MKFTQVKIQQIDTDDKRFQISPYFSVDSLMPSIEKAGLLNPPVLRRKEQKYMIVSGWRRITACQKLSISLIPVFVMAEKSDLAAFKIPVYENLSIRDYSQIEKASVIRKLHEFGEAPENIVKKFLPLLKLPPKREVMEVHLHIDRLKENIKKTAHQKRWSLGMLEIMTALDPEEAQALYPVINSLSLNKQKQLIENIFDVSRNQNISVQSVLNSGEMLRIKEDKILNPVQKAESLFRISKKLKNPTLHTWRKAFEEISRNLDLPEEMKVMPSKFFEGDTITIRLDIKNKEELEKHIRKLKELIEKKEVSLLFNPFSHE